MNDNPKVGIVIVNWNGYEDTIECVKSVRCSYYTNFEIIIVDNASSNNSFQILSESFPDITLVKNEQNEGFSRANNKGIKISIDSGADYVWLLNNDTTVSCFALMELVKASEGNKKIGLVGSVLYEYYEPWKIQAWGGGAYNTILSTTTTYFQKQKSIGHIIGASMFIRRETISDVGLLNENFFFFMEDTEYSRRVLKSGWYIDVADNSRVFHKGGASHNVSRDPIKNELTEKYFIAAVAKFMRINRSPLLYVILRVLLIVVVRIRRRQAGRIPWILRTFYNSYRSSYE